MNRLLALAAAVMVAAAPAAGQTVSDAQEKAAVVIYRGGAWRGLAFISETRTVDLPAGRQRIAFRGVADTMVSQTAAVEGLPGAMIERNQDYDLLSPGSLLEASVGRTVKRVRTDPKTGAVTVEPAVIRSGPDHPVLEVNGRLEGLGCSGAPERLVFDEVPANLTDKPTFSVLADVPRAGRYRVRLSYLATGFDWKADYVATLAPDGRTLNLTGWITLKNETSASFGDAPTQVVAGKVSRDVDTAPIQARASRIRVSCWPVRSEFPPLPVPAVERRISERAMLEEIVVTAAKRTTQSDLGDYKLYTLPEPTTIAARQTKQVLFLEQKRVPVERIYAYRLDLDNYDLADLGPPDVVLRLMNKASAGLGKPLPSGAVSVREPSGAGLVFAGENVIRDTPVGLPLEIVVGQALDVAVKIRVVADRSDDDVRDLDLEVVLSNGKPAPVILEYRQARSGQDFKVSDASFKPGLKNGEPMWAVRLTPGQSKVLTYRVTFKE